MSSLSAADLFSVKGRVAVVTGGSSGLGLMISKVSRFSNRYSWIVIQQGAAGPRYQRSQSLRGCTTMRSHRGDSEPTERSWA